MPHLHMLVGGRVQGVGFRWYCRMRAEERGVNGTVRNRADGTVEVEAEGARAVLESFRDDVLAGPHAARVEPIEERWCEGAPRWRDFRILA